LSAVSLSSGDNVWAVGGGQNGVLLEHFNGQRWTSARGAGAAVAGSALSGVAVLSKSDAWTVGWDGRSDGQPLIEHFNGSAWHVVNSPHVGGGGADLSAIAALSPANIWAVGARVITPGGSSTLIEHYNGARWSIASPSQGISDLVGVAARSANDIWAVGSTGSSPLSFSKTLVEHYNGVSWRVTASPNVGTSTNTLNAVTIAGAVPWAVGSYGGNRDLSKALAERFDGSKWVVSPTGHLAAASSDTLSGVVATSPHGLLAVGSATLPHAYPSFAEQTLGC